jgi:hypothetical protein
MLVKPSWRTVLKVVGVFGLIFGAAGSVLLTGNRTPTQNGADLKENAFDSESLIARFQPLSEGICNIRPLMDKCKVEIYPDSFSKVETHPESFSIVCPFLGLPRRVETGDEAWIRKSFL